MEAPGESNQGKPVPLATHPAGDGELVYAASSMAIRDQEAFLDGGDTDLDFLANRGANGIDGLIASGLGAALAKGKPTTIITGDLGFQHDVGSLALASSVDSPVRIVVLQNNGGAIFSKLPQKDHLEPDEFESLMTTSEGMSIEAAAGLFGLGYERVTDLRSIPDLDGPGTTVIEIPVAP